MKPYTEDNSIKRLAIFATISFAVAVLVGIGVFCFFFVELGGERETIEIPEFVGQRFENVGSYDDIRIESQPIFSSDVPEGVIISQEPYGGAKRKIAEGEKCVVKLTVSLGEETKKIPDLKNYKYTDAAAALRSLGAKIKIVSVFDDISESDRVLRTLPEAGKTIEKGDKVTLFVSRRHAREEICVKSFRNMTLDEAATAILAQGLSLGEVTREYRIGYSYGKVVSQSVEAGSVVSYGTPIDIVINENPFEQYPFRGR